MTDIIIKKEPTPYKTMNVSPSRDKRISFKARGILFYLLSKPKNWTCSVRDLKNNSDKDGNQSVASAMKELVAFGYAKLKPCRKSNSNAFGGRYYEIYETPCK